MRPLVVLSAIATISVVAWAVHASEQTATGSSQPTAAVDAVVLPKFYYNDGPPNKFGTAFVVNSGGKRVLVTAYHLIKVKPGKEREEITSVDLYTANGKEKRGTAGKPLLDTGKVSDGNDLSHDCALFENPQTVGGGVIPIAIHDVAVGDRVWIVGKSDGPPTPAFVPAEVVRIRDQNVALKMDTVKNMVGFSGSPYVNQSGQVLGIVLMSDNKQFVLCSRLNDLLARLAEAKPN